MDGSNPQAFKSPEKHTDGTVVTEGNIPWSLGPGFSPFSPRAVQASLALSAIFGHANETKEVDIRGNRQHAAISAAVSAASSGTVDSGGRRGTTKVSRSGRTRRAVSFDGAVVDEACAHPKIKKNIASTPSLVSLLLNPRNAPAKT